MRSALTKLVRQCDKSLKSSTCPIIEILQRDYVSLEFQEHFQFPGTLQIPRSMGNIEFSWVSFVLFVSLEFIFGKRQSGSSIAG
jgi:hypothetical protein